MGKRANIRSTARNTAALMEHAERDELVARGLLPSTASVADAQAKQREMVAERRATVQREAEDNASPKTQLLVGAVISVPLIVLAIVFSSAVLGWIAAIVTGASLLALLTSSNDANRRDSREAAESET
ncbi:hypothetical protein [Actinomycetospora aeridis]|uniref:DUF3040 domain-containing protein n=1 Tax=Actinomycetospora aeridis TaxID=3129231 RepID=A0ABU8NEN9_9PSEU